MKKLEKHQYGGEASIFLHERWETLRRVILATRPILGEDGLMHCEIWQYEYEMGMTRPHICSSNPEMNETLYMRNDFPPELQWYLISEINCSLACGAAHNRIGHTIGFRRWFRARQIMRYGSKIVDDFLLLGPNKVKTLNY